MTKEELMKDSEQFRNKEGHAYVHIELGDEGQCQMFINGHAPAVEAVAYELLNRVAETRGVPLAILMAAMLAHHEEMDDILNDTLDIE